MRDEHNNTLAATHAQDGLLESGFTFRVKVRVWFVENDQEGVAIEGPCESNALTLAGRQSSSSVADASLIAVRHRKDHLVDPGQLRLP